MLLHGSVIGLIDDVRGCLAATVKSQVRFPDWEKVIEFFRQKIFNCTLQLSLVAENMRFNNDVVGEMWPPDYSWRDIWKQVVLFTTMETGNRKVSTNAAYMLVKAIYVGTCNCVYPAKPKQCMFIEAVVYLGGADVVKN